MLARRRGEARYRKQLAAWCSETQLASPSSLWHGTSHGLSLFTTILDSAKFKPAADCHMTGTIYGERISSTDTSSLVPVLVHIHLC